MAEFLRALEHPLLDALNDALAEGKAAPYLKPGRFSWSRGGRVDIPFRVPVGGPVRIRAGLIGSSPPTAFFVEPHQGRRYITQLASFPREVRDSVLRLRQGSFSDRELRAELSLDAELLARDDFEEAILVWARARIGDIVASGLLDHPLPPGKRGTFEADELEAEQ
jgi:hypothetical protein